MLRLLRSAPQKLVGIIRRVQQPGGRQAITGGKCVTLIELCKASSAEGRFRSDLQCQALRQLSLHTSDVQRRPARRGGDRVRALAVTHDRRSRRVTCPLVAVERVHYCMVRL